MSNFNILTVRDGTAEDVPYYPFPGEQSNTVEPLESDGRASAPLQIGEACVYELDGSGLRRVVRVNKVRAQLVMTESRIHLACSKYEKGGGWTPWSLGAIPVALAANAVSKAMAARRRRGKMLVGHVLYPWVTSVGFKEGKSPIGHDVLRIALSDPLAAQTRTLILDLSVPRGSSGAQLAAQLTGLIASHRLRTAAPEDPAHRETLQALLDPPALAPEPKQFVSYSFVPPPVAVVAGPDMVAA